MSETIKCAECSEVQPSPELRLDPGCVGCGVDLCVFCGCTEARGCVRTGFKGGGVLTCSWGAEAVCDFCLWNEVEKDYNAAVKFVEDLQGMRVVLDTREFTTMEGLLGEHR